MQCPARSRHLGRAAQHALQPRSGSSVIFAAAAYPSRSFHLDQRLWAEKKEERQQDEGSGQFRGQLYASTFQRLQRERADEERFARERAKRNPMIWQSRFSFLFVTLAVGIGGWYIGHLSPKKRVETSTTTLADSLVPQPDTRQSVLQAAWTDFALIVGKDNVSTIPDDLLSHSTSEWASYINKEGERPFCVVYPATTDEVSKIMQVCHRRKIPVVALSGGTSLEGHFAPTRGGISIDLNRMDNIVEFHPEDLDIVVQPAIGWEDLNEYLAEQNMFFPPDPGPGAKIGGMIGTSCSGTNAYRYGTMRDWVLNVTVVLADGTVIKTRRRPRKSSAGYNLTQLFIGSEGTLGIVTEATLKVAVRPKTTRVGVATFPTIHDAASCVANVVSEGIQLAGIEILDDVQLRIINHAGTTRRKWEETPSLFFKFADSKEAVKEQIALVTKLAKASKNSHIEFARDEDEAAELWSARKEALWSVLAVRRDSTDHVWTTDVAVPISRLADIIQETKDDIAASGLIGTILGHVGDGNFHSILLYNDSEKQKAEDVVHRMINRAIAMEGTVTGEHGVGLKKREYLVDELGQNTIDTMRKVKQALDPLGILNPDKIIQLQKGF
ncbi:hypothetical protein DV736_g634, partial [Chaetothyriales sp. CBS 134916]